MVGAEKLYLKETVHIEPLFNRWHAWIHLLPPATAALNLSDRYLKVMNSYVSSPAMHAAAAKNPALKGGPFLNLDGKHVQEVRDLIQEIQSRNSKLLEFSLAIKELNKFLADWAHGESLEALYSSIPELLKGYVEPCYDLNHKPSLRLLESLLYRSELYDQIESSQSLELSDIATDGVRPFVLGTPRMRSQNALSVNLPFSSSKLDMLFSMRNNPQTYDEVSSALNCEIENERLFKSFFTNEPARPYKRYDEDSFRIRYFGHACLLIETRNVRILVDPLVSYASTGKVSRFTYCDLPEEIDYALITHSHHDHAVPETLLQLRPRIETVIVPRNYDGFLHDPSLQLALQHLNFKNVVEIRDLQEIPIPDGAITGVPFIGEHHDLLMQSRTGYHIRIGSESVLCIADSCNIEPELYDHLRKTVGDADILFLGMECDGAPPSWIYGPLFPQPLPREVNQSRRARGSNFKEACALLDRFNFKQVYVYAMGQEPWLTHILDNEFSEESNPVIQSRQLIDECKSRGIVSESLFGKKEIRP